MEYAERMKLERQRLDLVDARAHFDKHADDEKQEQWIRDYAREKSIHCSVEIERIAAIIQEADYKQGQDDAEKHLVSMITYQHLGLKQIGYNLLVSAKVEQQKGADYQAGWVEACTRYAKSYLMNAPQQ